MSSAYPFVPLGYDITIDRAEGAYLCTADGRRVLDAAGGAIVTNIGHGRAEVAEAVAEATLREGYVVPPWLTPSRTRLVERLQKDWLPPAFTHMHLCCGGSEGVESAMKIAIQHFAVQGRPAKHKVIGRSLSYHGTTLATTAVGGHAARRKGLAHTLQRHPVTPTPYPLRCPGNDAGRYYVEAVEAVIEREGPDTIAAFLGEPVVGASGGALVPPDAYWPGVRELCDKHGILLIVDEVMTGFGRTGTQFGYQHWPFQPDLIVGGKGLAGGYAPLTAVFGTDAVAAPIIDAEANVMFHTFAAHPGACAAADKVLEILTRERLVERSAQMGAKLHGELNAAFENHPHVAEVRGLGLLLGVEIVQDRGALALFPEADNITGRVVAEALRRGVFFYGGGTGEARDIIVVGPPFTIDDGDLDQIVTTLRDAVDAVV